MPIVDAYGRLPGQFGAHTEFDWTNVPVPGAEAPIPTVSAPGPVVAPAGGVIEQLRRIPVAIWIGAGVAALLILRR